MSDMLNEKFEEFVTEQKVIVELWRSYANRFCKRYSWHW